VDDVLLKAAAIERALRRVREEHAGDDARLLHDQTRQDAIVLNLAAHRDLVGVVVANPGHGKVASCSGAQPVGDRAC
jgi:hypothetical protein